MDLIYGQRKFGHIGVISSGRKIRCNVVTSGTAAARQEKNGYGIPPRLSDRPERILNAWSRLRSENADLLASRLAAVSIDCINTASFLTEYDRSYAYFCGSLDQWIGRETCHPGDPLGLQATSDKIKSVHRNPPKELSSVE
jgi:hypothetical protein